MRVLVTAASKHGATAEIALSIAKSLEDAGHHTVVVRPQEITTLDGYDGVVLGSAVYGGHWLEEGRGFAKRFSDELAELPVWLFSSGPIGDPPKPLEDPVDSWGVRVATRAREHRLFPGRMLKHELGFAERAIATALRAPDGDYRSWPEIDAWAREIARALDLEPARQAERESIAMLVGREPVRAMHN